MMDLTPSHFSGLPAAVSPSPPMGSPSEIGMRHARKNRTANVVWSPTDVGKRVCDYLRRLYPSRTIENVAADVAPWHVSRFTVAKMFERQTAPGAILWVAMIDAYGPDFLAAALPKHLGWLDEAAHEQRRQALDARIASLEAERERLLEHR